MFCTSKKQLKRTAHHLMQIQTHLMHDSNCKARSMAETLLENKKMLINMKLNIILHSQSAPQKHSFEELQ